MLLFKFLIHSKSYEILYDAGIMIERNERITINRMIGQNRAIRSASTANCSNVHRFAITLDSTSTSDGPFSAPLKYVR